MSSRRLQTRRIITESLRTSSPAELPGHLSALPSRDVLNSLFSCLCHPEEMVRWRAVTGFGIVVPAIADRDPEEGRVIMRRFLWMLNDESGGIGWGVPEAMAEVMAGNRLLAGEYLHMLVSYTQDDGPESLQHGNFLEHEILQEGVLWGMCRVAPLYPEHLLKLGVADSCAVYFASERSGVRGLVCRLSGLLGLSLYRRRLVELRADRAAVRLYEDGMMRECRVADLADQALQAIEGDQEVSRPGGSGATGSPPRQ